jgi:hypothetical protein
LFLSLVSLVFGSFLSFRQYCSVSKKHYFRKL